MEHRRKHPRGNHAVKKANRAKNAASTSSLPNIAELIKYGKITIGEKPPMGCLATACDEDRSLAMLVRRHGESLSQLLTRLDQAIAKAQNQGVFTDEVNRP